jgi:phosphoglucomutase
MTVSSLAGHRVPPALLVNIPELITAYYAEHPDPTLAEQRVAFGTSGHRGSSLAASFNDDHIAATTQAICEYRTGQGIDGPLFLGRDTHALSSRPLPPRWRCSPPTCVTVMIAPDRYTPTPALSHAILNYNAQPERGPRRRHRHHALAQPPGRRRLQVQPAQRRPGRQRHHPLDQDRANRLLAERLLGVDASRYARARPHHRDV